MNISIPGSARMLAMLSALMMTLLVLASCTTVPTSPPGAAEARAKLTRLQSDPTLTRLAPVEIREAEAAVAIAEAPVPEDAALGEHRVYIADRKVEIAMAKASTRLAESQRESLSRERATARLASRTVEADRARSEADEARGDADEARGEADALRASAAIAELKETELQEQIDLLQAEATDRGLVLTLGNVLFATGKSDLKTGSVTSLEKLVRFLEKYPDRSAAIEGHTDDVGSAEMNQGLSRSRAESVMRYLVQHGIQPQRLTATGMGESSPVSGNDSETGRQQNRRVEIVIDNPPAAVASDAVPGQ